MIFADKLIKLRKQAGLSQEQLAEKLDVTRQAISKWEGDLSFPDIPNVLKMCRLFGVSSDYLLNDDMTEQSEQNIIPYTDTQENHSIDKTSDIEQKGKEFSEEVLGGYKKSTVLCIVSLSVFLLLAGIIWFSLIVYQNLIANKIIGDFLVNSFVVAGISAVLVAAITGICIYDFVKLSRYMNKPFDLDEEAKLFVLEKVKKFSLASKLFFIFGIVFLLVSPLPFCVGSLFTGSQAARSVYFFIGLIMYIAAIDFFTVFIKIKISVKSLLSPRIKTNIGKKAKIFVAFISVVWAFVITLYIAVSAVYDGWNDLYWILIAGGVIGIVVCVATLYFIWGVEEKDRL